MSFQLGPLTLRIGTHAHTVRRAGRAPRGRDSGARQEQPGLEELTLIPVLHLHGAPADETSEGDRSTAEVDGFNLHASPPMAAENRVALERLCRSALRGPLALGRLNEGRRGQMLYRLKSPRRDGLTGAELAAEEEGFQTSPSVQL